VCNGFFSGRKTNIRLNNYDRLDYLSGCLWNFGTCVFFIGLFEQIDHFADQWQKIKASGRYRGYHSRSLFISSSFVFLPRRLAQVIGIWSSVLRGGRGIESTEACDGLTEPIGKRLTNLSVGSGLEFTGETLIALCMSSSDPLISLISLNTFWRKTCIVRTALSSCRVSISILESFSFSAISKEAIRLCNRTLAIECIRASDLNWPAPIEYFCGSTQELVLYSLLPLRYTYVCTATLAQFECRLNASISIDSPGNASRLFGFDIERFVRTEQMVYECAPRQKELGWQETRCTRPDARFAPVQDSFGDFATMAYGFFPARTLEWISFCSNTGSLPKNFRRIFRLLRTHPVHKLRRIFCTLSTTRWVSQNMTRG